MSKPLVRTEKWVLGLSDAQRRYAKLTVLEYRAYCRALSGVVMTHYPEIMQAESSCNAVERLTHRTKRNPNPTYPYFSRRFHKFPSYLRRAAIAFVIGQVSSFLTRYDTWQTGNRTSEHNRPPRFNPNAGANPSLYRGQLLKWRDDFTRVELKLFDGREWLWHSVPIIRRGKRNPSHSKLLNPMLLSNGKQVVLAVPHQFPPPKTPRWEAADASKALGVDLGINNAASMAVVERDGTVTYRGFIHPGVDMDRRDKNLSAIRKRAALTGALSEGFCRKRYRKARNRNQAIGKKLAHGIIRTALEHGVKVIVFEYLKGFRPRGGRYRSSLRQRFHTWLHRLVQRLVTERAQELGIRVTCVSPYGTSKYAFDGSGEVKRDPRNAALAVFTSGKQYNADLNAAYNIAAKHHVRYWQDLQLEKSSAPCGGWGNHDEARSGRSSGRARRIPVTLSTLWLYAREAEGETPPTLARAS